MTTVSTLAGWSNFYVITGSSAAALTGLMFVVVSLVRRRERPEDYTREGFATFSTPTVVHFGAAFLLSGIMSAPWHSLVALEIAVRLLGICGIIYGLLALVRTRRLTIYRPVLEDWVWFAILPPITYLGITMSAVFLPQALFGIAAGTMLLLIIGIHNAWDVVTYIAIDNVQE